MKILNKTRWNTGDILKLLRECFRRIGEDIREYTIEVVDARSPTVRGWGSYHRKWMKLCLPTRGYVQGADGKSVLSPLTELTGNRTVRIAQVAMHESDHTRGLHHGDMLPSWKMPCDWARDYVIRRKPPKPKPTMEERVRRRYERVLELIKQKERKLKLMRTSLRKLYKRKKYYERKFSKNQGKVGSANEVDRDGERCED